MGIACALLKANAVLQAKGRVDIQGHAGLAKCSKGH